MMRTGPHTEAFRWVVVLAAAAAEKERCCFVFVGMLVEDDNNDKTGRVVYVDGDVSLRLFVFLCRWIDRRSTSTYTTQRISLPPAGCCSFVLVGKGKSQTNG